MDKVFAVISCDSKVLDQSTSGGAFSCLAHHVIEQGGLVVGAVYAEDLSIHHAVARTVEELAPMRGVKYAFGTIDKFVYEEIAAALSIGKFVMVTGTPCQIAAMRKRFGNNKYLLLVDLVCFGAPAQDVWLKYVRWLEAKKGKRLLKINPRDKKYGWGRKTYYGYYWEDGRVAHRLSLFDPYAQLFYSTLGFRACCFNCQFRGEDHQSDITIGDCWGAERLPIPAERRRNGVSLVITHNEFAAQVLKSCDGEKIEIDESVVREDNKPYYESPEMRYDYDAFQVDLKEIPFERLIAKYSLQVTKLQWLMQVVKGKIQRILSR